jgi:hypothetical protein
MFIATVGSLNVPSPFMGENKCDAPLELETDFQLGSITFRRYAASDAAGSDVLNKWEFRIQNQYPKIASDGACSILSLP